MNKKNEDDVTEMTVSEYFKQFERKHLLALIFVSLAFTFPFFVENRHWHITLKILLVYYAAYAVLLFLSMIFDDGYIDYAARRESRHIE